MKDSEWQEKSIDELDQLIGQYLLADDLGFKSFTQKEFRETAQRWFAMRLGEIRKLVCTNPKVQKLLTSKSKQDRNELFCAVVDALLTFAGCDHIPIAALAARLLHYGIDSLCTPDKCSPPSPS